MNRRGFLGGLTALFAAPAIVRVASIMPVSVPKVIFDRRWLEAEWRRILLRQGELRACRPMPVGHALLDAQRVQEFIQKTLPLFVPPPIKWFSLDAAPNADAGHGLLSES